MKILHATLTESVALFLSEVLARQPTIQAANEQLQALTGIIDFFSDQSDWQLAISELADLQSEVEEHNAVEYGDFQTSDSLALRVCETLSDDGYCPTILVEPTCGQGNFILAALRRFPTIRRVYAVEIYKPYVYQCKINLLAHFMENPDLPKPAIYLRHQSIFDADFTPALSSDPTDELLILGNPPWVTNATLGAMTSGNLPVKTNAKQHTGLDALTGKSNFDIAEFITVQLLTQFQYQRGHLVLLVKNSVIKNIVFEQLKRPLRIATLQKRVIDAKKEFNVSVEAAVFSATLNAEPEFTCLESPLATDRNEFNRFGWVNRKFVSNQLLYHRLSPFDGTCRYEWRQGIKHDCAAVMEMEQTADGFSSAVQASIHVENDLIYPFYKSSDLQKPVIAAPRKFTFVLQHRIGADTGYLKSQYPKTYCYLNQYRTRFDERKSSIYQNKPPFSIFGIGEYSFKPYKVAISGLYKTGQFTLVLPINRKPAMLDDTCYFLGFDTLTEAVFTLLILNHATTRQLLQVITFTDAKRVYTKDVLMRIDLTTIARSIPFSDLIASCPDYLIDAIDPDQWVSYQHYTTQSEKQAERQLSLF